MGSFFGDVFKGALGRLLGRALEGLPWALLIAWMVSVGTWAGSALLSPAPRYYVVVGSFASVALYARRLGRPQPAGRPPSSSRARQRRLVCGRAGESETLLR